MKLNSDLFADFLKCPTKCYLHATGQIRTGNAYSEWVREQNDAYWVEAKKRLISALPENEVTLTPQRDQSLKAAKWSLAVDLSVQAGDLEARIQAIENGASDRANSVEFIPVLFTPVNKVTINERLLVVFEAFVLSEALGQEVRVGKIVHGDEHATLRISTAPLLTKLKALTSTMAATAANESPPDLILTHSCAECEFQDSCKQKALEKDDLSLLSGMSEKERKAYHRKGLFTVTQLSHTFRPRRHRKRHDGKPPRYQHPLRALALREKKVHVVGSFEFKIVGTLVYLDVEGIPDRDQYYLIGMRTIEDKVVNDYSFWADDLSGEKRIWQDFLYILAKLSDAVIIHYGAYEKKFLRVMSERYGSPVGASSAARAIASSLNVLSAMYARVYFPAYTNRLKDVAAVLGFRWASPEASGLRTIEWRLRWEASRDDKFKERLIQYNHDDCSALALVTEHLVRISENPHTCADVVMPDEPTAAANERSAEIHRSLKQVLNSAHWDYSKARIRLNAPSQGSQSTATKAQCSRPRAARKLPSIKGRIIRCSRKRKCQRHLDRPTLLRPQHKMTEHALLDITFTKAGCRKTIVRYFGKNARCPYCNGTFPPPGVKRVRNQLYDRGFQCWVAYLRIALRLSYRLIAKATDDLFHEPLSPQSAETMVRNLAERYEQTENLLLAHILRSPSIHVDETRLSIVGIQQYVWVLSDGKRAVFRLTEGRETDFLVPILTGYEGTLITDFYGGYDAMPCRQQKCLVHLIGDLNDDLWKAPFDTQFENFVASVRDLLLPILADVDRFGLKAYHLRKHGVRVEQFYEHSIGIASTEHELMAKYQKRFVRFQDSLFTFLRHDNVPWNNNAAERALRHLAVQRKISGSFTSKGARHYLRLLGIAQSCLFQGKSFLGFLRSGETNLDTYIAGSKGNLLLPTEPGID